MVVADGPEKQMPFPDAARTDGTLEECLDELNELMAGLQRYSPTVLAMALRVHLEAMLQALLEAEVCTTDEVSDFVKELERETLEYNAK